MTKRSALGKGLSALLSDTEEDISKSAVEVKAAVSGVGQISVSQIEKNPFQPRIQFDKESLMELSNSIRVHGVIQPITVRKLGFDRYQLIAGERRLEASKLAGLTNIPAHIRVANDEEMLEMAIIENIQREDLNPIEIAVGYKRLMDECSITQEELAQKVGKDRTTVTNFIRLLKLPPEIQVAVRDKKITMGHARAIINVEKPEEQLHIFRKTIHDDLSVRQVEELVRNLTGENSGKRKAKMISAKTIPLNTELKKIEERLRNKFGTKIELKYEKGKGEIRIHYYSDDDLNRLIEMME